MVLRSDTTDFKRLFQKSSQVPAQLRTNLRRDIRNVAKTVAQSSKDTVMQAPLRQSSHSRSTGLRSKIASGITVSILTGNTKIGVTINSSGKALDGAARSLVRAYDKAGGWRHPVFGDTAVYVTQFGRPYFYSVIAKGKDKITAVVEQSMQTAVASLEDV
jgi:hypothetical protein